MKAYKTKSGSIYHVDGLRVRRTQRSTSSESERLNGDWQDARSVSCAGVGHPIEIVWGSGKDEHSDSSKTLKVGFDFGCDAGRLRMTVTSPVVEITDVN